MKVATEARAKKAFSTGQKLWQFYYMPFGLCNALETFEWLLDKVLVDIPHLWCVVYLDDLLMHREILATL